MYGKSALAATAVLLAAVAFGAATTAVALAQSGAATTRVYEPRQPAAQGLTVTDVREVTADALVYSRWGCIFAGLAMVGVIWMGWSLRTIARNQVELGRLIREVGLSSGKQ